MQAALFKGSGTGDNKVAPAELRGSARALGLLCNTLLQSENDSGTTAANLLARHLINESYPAPRNAGARLYFVVFTAISLRCFFGPG